jgi:predicted dinucleotide-binding enzyme
MTRHTIGEALAARLYAAESAVDLALSETASLAAALPSARAAAYLSAVAGQRAFDGAAASISALAAARSHLVETHTTLAALARKLGLDTLAAGPLDKPGDTPPVGGGALPAPGPGMVNKALTNRANKSLPTTTEP